MEVGICSHQSASAVLGEDGRHCVVVVEVGLKSQSMRLGGQLVSGGSEAYIKGDQTREGLGATDDGCSSSSYFCALWLRGSVRYQFVVARVLSDLIMPQSGNCYPPGYIHKSVNLKPYLVKVYFSKLWKLLFNCGQIPFLDLFAR